MSGSVPVLALLDDDSLIDGPLEYEVAGYAVDPVSPAADTPRQSPGASVARGALALLSTQPLTWTTSLLAAVLVPHYLGAQSLGEYAIAMSVVGLAGSLVSLGVPSFLTRQIASLPEQAALAMSGGLVLLLGLSLVAATSLALVVPLLRLPVPRRVLDLVLAGMVISSGQTILSSVLIGRERHKAYAWINAGGTAIGACAGLAALAAGYGLVAYVAAGIVVASLNFVLTWRISHAALSGAAFAPGLLRRLALGGLPFLGWTLTLYVYGSIDNILLAFLTHASVVGWYTAAYRIIGIPVFIPTLVTTPLLPVLSRSVGVQATFESLVRRSVTAVLLLTVPIAALIVALAPSVPGLLHWPAEFRHSVPLMMILALHQPIVAVDMVLATALFALHRERQWLWVGVIAAVLNPALNLALIPVFQQTLHNGAIAASVLTVATELFMLVGALVLLPRGLVERRLAGSSIRILCAGLGLCAVTAALRPLFLPLAVAAGGITFASLVFALRLVAPADVRTLRLGGRAS